MENTSKIESHLKDLRLRTIGSVVLYGAFVICAIVLAVQKAQYSVENPLTMATLALIVLAFVTLPRDYKPAHIVQRQINHGDHPLFTKIDQLQRFGVLLRVSYAAVAFFLIWGLPRLVSL